MLRSPREFCCPLPSVMGRVPAAAGEGVLLGDKVMQLELSFSLSVFGSTWIMFIGFFPAGPLRARGVGEGEVCWFVLVFKPTSNIFRLNYLS